jgi:hypothetical protein
MSIYSPASNKAFGFLFAGICAFLSVFFMLSGEAKVAKYVLLFASCIFILISLKAPHRLAPLNRAWMKLGQIMGLIISPLILGIIFFLLITPFSIVARLCGRDELILKKPDTQSFWRDRVELSSSKNSFKNQF